MVNADNTTIMLANHGDLSDSPARANKKKSPKRSSSFRRVRDALTPRIFSSKSKSANRRKPEISSPLSCTHLNSHGQSEAVVPHQFSPAEPDGQINLAGAEKNGDVLCLKSVTITNQLINSSELKNVSRQPQRHPATATEPTKETEKDVCSPPTKPKRDPRYINTPLAEVETLADPTSIPFADKSPFSS